MQDWPERYYTVIFSSMLSEPAEGYADMADRMVELASEQPGFLGVESARGADGFGITVSYWESQEAIRHWKAHTEHQEAQRLGRETWYASYSLRIAEVIRSKESEPTS